MNRVKIMTDSTADLPYSLIERCGIVRVPLHIILGENSYPDDQNLKTQELFSFADKTGTLPKSAAVNTFEFEEVFKTWLDQGYDIFFTGISSKLSATMQSALAAAKQFDKGRIAIVDSLSLSTGLGLLVLEASDLAQSGASLAEIAAQTERLREKVRASFVVDTLKYLYMGGRCSRLQSIVGSRLKLKPMLELKNGEIVPGAKFRGSGYIRKYCAHILEKAADIDPKRICVTHCMAPEANDIKEMLHKDHGFANVMVTDASPTIATHCGPGTLGILYIER